MARVFAVPDAFPAQRVRGGCWDTHKLHKPAAPVHAKSVWSSGTQTRAHSSHVNVTFLQSYYFEENKWCLESSVSLRHTFLLMYPVYMNNKVTSHNLVFLLNIQFDFEMSHLKATFSLAVFECNYNMNNIYFANMCEMKLQYVPTIHYQCVR